MLNGEWRAVPESDTFRDETRGFTRPGRIVIPGIVFQTTGSASVNRLACSVPFQPLISTFGHD